MEPEDALPIRDPYRLRVKLGDVVLLPGGRTGVIVEFNEDRWLPIVQVHLVGVSWWKNFLRHLTDQDRYFDKEIDELTFVS